jgi:1-acyl-sn-glycerol-3-phosphate acyltransferase
VACMTEGDPTLCQSAPTDNDRWRPRHFLLNGVIGVRDRRTYVRAAVGIAAWLFGPLLLARLLGRIGRRQALHSVLRRWARLLAWHLQLEVDISGLEHIEPGTAYIVTPLHEGLADAIALLHLPLDLRFVARDELFEWPFFGGLLRDTAQVRICPEQGAQSYLQLRRQAPAVLASGESLVVFPQGSILGIEIDFKAGPFALAAALDRPILPIVLTGSHRVWEHPFSPCLRYAQRVSLQVLPPILPSAYRSSGVEALRAEVQRQLKTRAMDEAMATPRRFVPSRDGYWDGFAFAIDPAFPNLYQDIERHRAQIRSSRQPEPDAIIVSDRHEPAQTSHG